MDPVKSTALVPYNPPKPPSVQARTLMERIGVIYMESSFKTQIADLGLQPKVGEILQTSDGSFVRKTEQGLTPVSVRDLVLAGDLPTSQFRYDFPKPYQGTRTELLSLISETVHTTLDHLDYNGLPTYIKLFEQLAMGRDFLETRMDSRNEEPGTACVGMTHALLKELKAKHGIEGMFAAQRLQGHRSFCHAVAIVQCTDGYVLLDPRSDPNIRIFSIPFNEEIQQGSISLTASKPGSTTPLRITYTTPEGDEETYEYCTHIENADDLVMKHFMMDAPFAPPKAPAFPVSAYFPDGGASKCIWVSPLKSKLTLKNMTLPKEHPERTVEVSFREVQEGLLRSRLERLYDSGLPTFHIPLELLHEQLVKFVANAATLDKIFHELHRKSPS